MHNAELVTQPVNVILDVCLQGINVETVLVQGVKNLLFEGESRRVAFISRLLIVDFQALTELRKELARDVCNDV